MQLKTIFNRVTNYKPFVVEHIELIEHKSQPTLEITMRARENGLPTCSGCGQRCSGYDSQPTSRRFDFIGLWMIRVELIYTMRRVNCPTCGVKVERVPWAEGKSPLTTEYQWFLAGWARRMSWKEVARCFGVSWDHVYNSVQQAVSWGLSHRSLAEIESIGVDEVQWKRGHKYQTLALVGLKQGRSTKGASVCCGSAQIARPGRYFVSSVSWARIAVRRCCLFAATCGRLT